MEELERLRNMVHSQQKKLDMYEESRSISIDTKLAITMTDLATQTTELLFEPPLVHKQPTPTHSNEELEANRKKYNEALKARNLFAITINHMLENILGVKTGRKGHIEFEDLKNSILTKIKKLSTIKDLQKLFVNEKNVWVQKLEGLGIKYQKLEVLSQKLVRQMESDSLLKKDTEAKMSKIKQMIISERSQYTLDREGYVKRVDELINEKRYFCYNLEYWSMTLPLF
jgi:hypothetical protein